jgi:hypothetical protein
MVLLALTIPLMVLAVAIALVPLVVATARDERPGTPGRTAENLVPDLAARPLERAAA